MGILPLQFQPGQDARSLGITGTETFDIEGIAGGLSPGHEVTIRAASPDGKVFSFRAIVRINTPAEAAYYRHGGILPFVLSQLIS
jgi:aconitate hydratase